MVQATAPSTHPMAHLRDRTLASARREQAHDSIVSWKYVGVSMEAAQGLWRDSALLWAAQK